MDTSIINDLIIPFMLLTIILFIVGMCIFTGLQVSIMELIKEFNIIKEENKNLRNIIENTVNLNKDI